MKPLHFIGAPVEVVFDSAPLLEKKPHCPDGFVWEGQSWRVERVITEWFNFDRRGRAERNMRPAHAGRAAIRGSWGVGKFYYRVQVTGGRIFELVYDRAPEDADRGKGTWFLLMELEER